MSNALEKYAGLRKLFLERHAVFLHFKLLKVGIGAYHAIERFLVLHLNFV